MLGIMFAAGARDNMLKITKARETRKRDKKRNRVVLHIWKKKYHISKEEAYMLSRQLKKAYGKEFYKG